MNATTPTTTNERSAALATPPLYPTSTNSGKGTVSMTINADNLLIDATNNMIVMSGANKNLTR